MDSSRPVGSLYARLPASLGVFAPADPGASLDGAVPSSVVLMRAVDWTFCSAVFKGRTIRELTGPAGSLSYGGSADRYDHIDRLNLSQPRGADYLSGDTAVMTKAAVQATADGRRSSIYVVPLAFARFSIIVFVVLVPARLGEYR